jgi:hypothetical protein
MDPDSNRKASLVDVALYLVDSLGFRQSKALDLLGEIKLVSAFPTRPETSLRPFMSTVFAFVRVLELFDVNDYRFSLLNGYGSIGGRHKTA